MAASDDDRFLDEAVARGFLTRGQADDCRRLRAALGEVEVELTVDEVLARKGYLPRERSAELRRALARQRIGRYEVIERLGEGGSGVVWKARDVVLDRLVALKLLAPAVRDDPRWRERFLREARTAVTLNHTGIVRGLDCGEADGYLYFAMEYVPGETLTARLRREGRLPEKEGFRIAAEVVRVLRYVAGLGIVHRDLKPDNLMVTPDGRVKVCDLGLARPTREEAERAGAGGALAGTPLYLAPEQIRDGDRVDWRADVYALGATLYHLVAGRPPFPFEKGRDLFQRHLTEIPPSPREFALDLSPNAAAVILRMLQKDPADRYARLEDLEADLESVIAGRPPVHTVSFAMERKPTVDVAAARAAATERRGVRWAAVGATLLALAMVGVASVLVATRCVGMMPWFAPPPSPPPPRLPPPARAPAPLPDAGPAVVATDTPAEAAARRALETARKLATERPDDLAAKREAFRFVAEQHAGTSSADIARGIVESLGREIDANAVRTMTKARESAARAEAAGRIAEAIALWTSTANDLAGTPHAAEATAEARRLRDLADTRLRTLLDDARDAVAAREFDRARASLRDAEALDLPWAVREVASRRRDVESAESAWVADRAATKPAFERVWGAAVLKAGEPDGLEPALTTLDAAARTELVVWSREIDELRLDLLSMSRADAAPGPGDSALDQRAQFFRRLARRDLAGAEALVPRLGTAPGPLLDGVARVRAAIHASADGLLVLARAARAERRFDDAARLVERALTEAPGYPRARVVAATLVADRGRPDAALAELEKVLALPAPPAEAHLRVGQILATRRESWERAQAAIELYLSLAADGDPLRAEARASLEALVSARGAARVRELTAQLNAARDKEDDAGVVVAGEAIVALGGADWKTFLALGDAYANVDRPHDALVAYRRIVDGQPYEREWPRAQAAIRKLEQRYATAPGERDAVAAARKLLDANSVRESREALDAAVQRSPFFEDGLVAAAEAWLARKGTDAYAIPDDPRRALRLTEILRLRNPQHVRANELRAEALLRTGSFRDALELAVSCIDLDPVRPDPATTAGFALLALDDPAGALGRLQASLDRRRTARALYGRALAWERLGHRQAARDEATMLVESFGVPDEMASEVRALLGRLDLEVEDRPR